ncbi:ArdC-like ssDNA-binding domain-containing protein [Peribacillus butanolivorans]|uniref:ArdC-like ssDNA-binding domain-containing protein n=1 Tax=Peribacillus butanolivorans TaxID=421767 RepID=UPI0037CA0D6B
MANPKYSRKTNEQRKREIKDLSEKAFEEIEKYSNSPESLLEYADFLSRFHSYSLNNLSLIQNQFQGAIAVASFKDWKDKGYSVNKGEKGIEILSYAPVTLFKDSDGNRKQIKFATKEEKQLIKEGKISTKKVRNYNKGHVFDISQTNAPIEDLPKIFPNRQYNFTIEDGNNAAQLLKGIDAVAKELDIEIRDMKMSEMGHTELGVAKGVFIQNGLDTAKKEILLNSRNTPTQNLATAIHELAHAKMHYIGSEIRELSDTSTLEFQAELTSYIVCKHYGMDTSEKAIPYIASWTKNGQKLENKQKAMEGVHRTAAEFIEVMDTVISHEKELELTAEQEPVKYHDKLLLLQMNNGLTSDKLELENTEFWRKLEYSNLEDFNKYLTYRPLYQYEEAHGEVKFDDPKMYIHGVSNEFSSFGEVNSQDIERYKYADVIYTVAIPEDGEIKSFSGKYDSEQYVHPLHHIKNNELIDKETILKLEENWHDHLAVEESKHFDQWRNQHLKIGDFQPTEKEDPLFPIDQDEILHCDLSGKAIAQDEGYFHFGNGIILSEDAHKLVFTDKEWNELYAEDEENYRTTCYYDVDQSEMTSKEPEPIVDNKNIYYYYDGQSQPVKLGTVSDIVTAAQEQETIGHFSFNQELIKDFTFAKSENKEEFNEQMQKHSVLKNPGIKDFEKVNESLGLDKKQNLSNLNLRTDISKKAQMVLSRQIER